jgi:hypothetical protein
LQPLNHLCRDHTFFLCPHKEGLCNFPSVFAITLTPLEEQLAVAAD